MSKKQSSVEWFASVTAQLGYVSMEILEQAKAMHKEEIKDSWNDGHTEGMEGGYSGTYEEYYKETFGGQDNE
jgi:hypothetical protein